MTEHPADKRRNRKERTLDAHRREILEAAERVFAENGYVSTRVEQIAHDAAFAVGTIYNVFGSKEELYAALLSDKSDRIEECIDEAMAAGGSPAEQLSRLFEARIEAFWQHRLFFRLFFHETMNTVCDPRAGFTPEIRARYEAFLETLHGLFAQGIEAGEFRAAPVHLLVTAYEGILRGYLANLSRTPAPERNREEEACLLRLFIEGAQAESTSKRK
ncbi:MAG: TetR/AcrR family transcriptional regulator [Candidatus Hydrogenedentota bacterium]